MSIVSYNFEANREVGLVSKTLDTFCLSLFEDFESGVALPWLPNIRGCNLEWIGRSLNFWPQAVIGRFRWGRAGFGVGVAG